MVELIGIVKNEKARLQEHLGMLEDRVEAIRVRIGLEEGAL